MGIPPGTTLNTSVMKKSKSRIGQTKNIAASVQYQVNTILPNKVREGQLVYDKSTGVWMYRDDNGIIQSLTPASLIIPATGLELISEGGNDGFAFIGDPRDEKDDIGEHAVDLSLIRDIGGVLFVGEGATGLYSLAYGNGTTADGTGSIAGGGTNAVDAAFGVRAMANYSFSFGFSALKYHGTDATSTKSVVLGGSDDQIINSENSGIYNSYNSNITNSSYASIIGGREVSIEGAVGSRYSTVIGGYGGAITDALYSAIIGGGGSGVGNAINAGGDYSVILGGISNIISGTHAIAFGVKNNVSGNFAFGGGDGNSGGITISGENAFSFQKGGGLAVVVAGDYSAVLGGELGNINVAASHSVIIGGITNSVAATGLRSVILGGASQSAVQPDMVYLPGTKYKGLTTVEIAALTLMEEGTVVWDTTLKSFYLYNGSAWIPLGSGFWDEDAGNGWLIPKTATYGVNLFETTGTKPTSLIHMDGTRAIMFQSYGPNGTATPDGDNVFAGKGAGNVTIGSTATNNIEASHNIGIGGDALKSLTVGYRNLVMGQSAGELITTGSSNVILGYEAGKTGTTMSNCVFIGTDAGRVNTANGNVAIGGLALRVNSTGAQNVAIGYTAMALNSTGSRNTAIGYGAMDAHDTESDNVAIGYGAMTASYGGAKNTIVGAEAGTAITTGGSLVAVGYRAMYRMTSDSRGVAIGDSCMYNATNSDHVSVGYRSMYLTTTGRNNVAVGNYALEANQTGDYIIAIGHNGGKGIKTDNVIAIGYNAFSTNTVAVTNSIAVGNESCLGLINGANNVVLGHHSARFINGGGTAQDDMTDCIYIGYDIDSSASGCVNEIVLGNSQIGKGDNTVQIGNASTLQNYMTANLNIDNLSLNGQATGSLPGSPTPGMIAYDTTVGKLKVWTGAAWETITSA